MAAKNTSCGTEVPSIETEREVALLEARKRISNCSGKDFKPSLLTANSSDSESQIASKTQKTPTFTGRRSSLASRSGSKLSRPFKSPLQSRELCAPDEEKASLLDQIQTLEEKLEVLNKEVEELSKEYCEGELQEHIDKLHEYNEIKDVGQLIIGKLAEIDGTTTKAMYQEFGLDLDD
ncbi:DNA repair protein SWI5 homolog [Montipora capricornis]|uniref:DNA repair protein SWI5 homolog n=1 Tax=Montipora capricornis TaxID=246305 RepID=UPI0035F14784